MNQEIEQFPQTAEENPEPERLPVPGPAWKRLLYGLATAVLPFLCFYTVDFLAPVWQSGQWNDYAALILSRQASWVFFPLIAYSSASLILLLVAPLRFARHFAIRFGIYTGVLLSLQYSILVLPATLLGYLGFLTIPMFAAPFLLELLAKWLTTRW